MKLYIITYSTKHSTKNWNKVYYSKKEVKEDLKIFKMFNPSVTFNYKRV